MLKSKILFVYPETQVSLNFEISEEVRVRVREELPRGFISWLNI